jgi:hypothetical protein
MWQIPSKNAVRYCEQRRGSHPGVNGSKSTTWKSRENLCRFAVQTQPNPVVLIHNGMVEDTGLADTVQLVQSQVVIFGQMVSSVSAAAYAYASKDEKYLATEAARKRARALLSHGPDFIYGLVFREHFTFRVEIFPMVEGQNKTAVVSRW